MRRLAATLVALAVLGWPTLANAQEAGTGGCSQGGCTTSADEIRCWWPQVTGWFPAGSDPALSRQRADGRWEVSVGTDRYHQGSRCVEVLPGLWIYDDDAPGVAAYLKARYLDEHGLVELDGRVVPASLALGWFVDSGRAACESGRAWDASRDGYFQIIQQTWDSLGGREFASRAGLASAPDQVVMFLRVLDAQGARAWACGRGRP